MKNKNALVYIITIPALVIVLAVLWILMITGNTTNQTTVTSSNGGMSTSNNSNGGPGGMQGSSSATYSAVKEVTEDATITSGEYTSSTADENAFSASGDLDVTLSNVKVEKTGDSDGGDSTSFYGTNSAIIAKNGATLTIKNATITTDATGANGVFSYGGSATTNNANSDGTTVNISDSVITTTKGNSGGIMTTGGGTTNATNLTITTSGQSSAAIRSDRGGGTVNVDGGTYTTNGVGSPAIYSTANITVKNAKLISTASEGAIIEGKNSITLENVELTDTHTQNVKSKTYKNIFIYQSMSGDAAEGVATFTAKNSTITTNKGDSIYVSNTSAIINLTNNKFTNNDSTGYFLRAQADAWGNEGSNGGKVTLNLTNQDVDGNIGVDEVSSLTMKMVSSNFKGMIDAKDGEVKLTLDASSTITLTGDSYVTSLENADSTNSNINLNGYKLYVGGVEFSK
jgi:ribosomal protein L24